MQREVMEYDVIIVGGGPAGLSAAIRFKQLCQQQNLDLSICILEKGAEIGAHILSGAVFEPRALNELIPDWQQQGAPLNTPATHDQFLFLTKQKAFKLPIPSTLDNHGNYIISLANLCRWLAEYAETLGVDIFPGFAATQILYDDAGKVKGVLTGDMGLNKQGKAKSMFQPGMELRANYTLIAEGSRGSLAKQLINKFDLSKNSSPQTYGLGIKELWKIPTEQHQLGLVMHSVGWPMDHQTYGGSFIYHLEDHQVAVGFVVGLDYTNPYLNPFEEFQRFKTHPAIRTTFANGERIAYGARALNEGGYQSLPKLSFPGGLLIGCSAGFLNVPKIKGSHTAMKSGMIAAETIFTALQKNQTKQELTSYQTALENSWIWPELYRVRNIRPGFRWGLLPGLTYAAFDHYILRGRAPWTFANHSDHLQLKPAHMCKTISYPKPDGKITFDRLSSVYLSNTNHEEDQPVHLRLADPAIAIETNLEIYDSPEQYYCPAGVYEIIKDEQEKPRLQINAGNCIHCKTCDIKDPKQNINWVPPEGGGGPGYPNM